ncbi:MAG: hypothetical protein M1467_03885 [Deltaproteobacteria bacterium]|nr:hypothetical protein [Deltaproteobacteria bacterium]
MIFTDALNTNSINSGTINSINVNNRYFYDKFIEWGLKDPKNMGDYRPYIQSKGRNGLTEEFKNDVRFKAEICPYLRTYAKGREKESIFSIIQSVSNPDTNVIEILVGATLDACGYPNTGDKLIGLAILGLIGFALISLAARK